MKSVISIAIIFLLIQFGNAVTMSPYWYHQDPEPALLGETIRLEVNALDNSKLIYDARVFYRMKGQADYQSLRLRQEGILYLADIPTAKLFPGQLEYFFAFQGESGSVQYLPDENPFENPMFARILPNAEAGLAPAEDEFEVLMLSPEVGESVAADELLVAFSLPLEVEHPENFRYQLLINGLDVSNRLKQSGNLITFSPKSIRSGSHEAVFSIFDTGNKLLVKKDFAFRISGQVSQSSAFDYRANAFIDNRYQDLAGQSENFFRGGADVYGNYKKLDFVTRLMISSEESTERQPINQYGVGLRFNFTPRSNVYLNAGDFTVTYDPLSAWERRLRGIGGGFKTPYMNLDVSYGQSARAVEGTAIGPPDTSKVIIQTYGTYGQSFLSVRPEFNFGRYASWALNLINAKDDTASIKYGGNPKEALVVGTDLRISPHVNHIELRASVQASIKNEDARGEVNFDSIASRYDLSGNEKDLAEKMSNFLGSSGFLTLTQGLSPIPSVAMQFEAHLNYFNHNLRAVYKNIDAEYTSPGNPFMLKDISGLFINDNIRLLENQVFLNIYFNSYKDNLSIEEAKTNNTEFGGSISYFPFRQLPSVTLTYGTQTRKNQLAEDGVEPDSTIFYLEDNAVQRIGLSASYQLKTSAMNNTFTFSATKFARDDAAYDANQSNFNLFTFGIRTQFNFPLTSRLSYSNSSSEFGKDFSQSTTDIQKYFIGADYLFQDAWLKSDIKPYVNFTLQSIREKRLVTSDYNRMNYTAGLYFMNETYGNLSLRYDYLDFGDKYDWSDSIVNLRYEINL